jgi:2'-5' RNA ligase
MNDQNPSLLNSLNSNKIEKPEEPHKFSSTQIQLPDELAQHVLRFSAAIPTEDLAEDGREDDIHVTARYGLSTDDPAQIEKAISQRIMKGPIKISFGNISTFPPNPERPSEVLKLDVISPDLHEVHNVLAGVEHTDTYPVYVPHMTIAYVKPGVAQRYVGQPLPGVSGQSFESDKIRFSDRLRKKTDLDLTTLLDKMRARRGEIPGHGAGHEAYEEFLSHIFADALKHAGSEGTSVVQIEMTPEQVHPAVASVLPPVPQTPLPPVDGGTGEHHWGLPAGPLPLIVRQEPNPVEKWICPHCQNEIGEKSVFMDIANNNQYHRECGGQFTRTISPDEQSMIDSINKRWGVNEGYYTHCDDPDSVVRTEKKMPLINRSVIAETMAKSANERILRRTRIKNDTHEKRPAPVIKKSANNDPRQTSVGRASLKGSLKRNRDKHKRMHPEKFTESADFIRSTYKRSIDEVIQAASKLEDLVVVLETLDKMTSDKLDQEWIASAKVAVRSILESREYRSTPYFAIPTVQESLDSVMAVIKEDLGKAKAYFPDAWVGCELSRDKKIASYRIYTQRTEDNHAIVESIIR